MKNLILLICILLLIPITVDAKCRNCSRRSKSTRTNVVQTIVVSSDQAILIKCNKAGICHPYLVSTHAGKRSKRTAHNHSPKHRRSQIRK